MGVPALPLSNTRTSDLPIMANRPSVRSANEVVDEDSKSI